MHDLAPSYPLPARFLQPEKFQDPDVTAKGETRASVQLSALETLWLNTGSLCNIECAHCYINSSPKNDDLVYLSASEAAGFFDEIESENLGTREIGFTGGEPFMNREFPDMLEEALARGFSALVLTNAMQPMQRPQVKRALCALLAACGRRLTLRVSLDHYERAYHELERGAGSYDTTLAGIDWLAGEGFNIQLAGRTFWGEPEQPERSGYEQLIRAHGWPVDAFDPHQLVLFPEMDARADVPEITTACWSILHKRPDMMMCATSRMVVKRKGMARPVVVPCTLIAYERSFEMGTTLREAAAADDGMFARGAVKLCHPHCARFCVLGGGSCTV